MAFKLVICLLNSDDWFWHLLKSRVMMFNWSFCPCKLLFWLLHWVRLSLKDLFWVIKLATLYWLFWNSFNWDSRVLLEDLQTSKSTFTSSNLEFIIVVVLWLSLWRIMTLSLSFWSLIWRVAFWALREAISFSYSCSFLYYFACSNSWPANCCTKDWSCSFWFLKAFKS